MREKRRAAGKSQSELGDVLGVGEMQVQKYETGASPLTVVRLVKAAEFLGCKTTDLLP